MAIAKTIKLADFGPLEGIVNEYDDEDDDALDVLLKTFIQCKLEKHIRHLEFTLERETGRLRIK